MSSYVWILILSVAQSFSVYYSFFYFFKTLIDICYRAAVQSNLSTAGSLIQSILKEGDTPKFSEEEQRLCCVVMCTSEYCMETSQQLEEKLKEKTDQKLSSQISLSAEQDIFHGYGITGSHMICIANSIANGRIIWPWMPT